MNSTIAIFIGILIFSLGQVGGWFQLNSQFVWKWWEDKPLLSAILFGIPTSILFWYAWRMVSTHADSVWSARFIGSGTGYLVFPILTWYLLGESMFTPKTLVCLALAVLIILIQVFW